jgi:hypothetical protein
MNELEVQVWGRLWLLPGVRMGWGVMLLKCLQRLVIPLLVLTLILGG